MTGFNTFVDGNVLSAADVNGYLMSQVMIICTSSTRPSSPAEGWHIYETDTNLIYVHDGSGWVRHGGVNAWTSYTPTWTNLTTTSGTATGAWTQIGKVGHFYAVFTAGASSAFTAAQPTATLPFTAASSSYAGQLHGFCYDTSASNAYAVLPLLASTTTAKIQLHTNDGSGHGQGTNFGATSPMTMANGDILAISGTLQIA